MYNELLRSTTTQHPYRMIKQLAISIRPLQWYKNIVLFIGIIFSGNAYSLEMWLKIVPAFIVFCVLSSSGYLVNDMLDIDNDRNHPVKSRRPIASGNMELSNIDRGLLISP